MEALSDDKLVMLVQTTKDTNGYAILVARHQYVLKAFLFRLVGDDMSVDDIAQDTIMLAYEKIKQFRFESSFRTWLFRIGYMEYLQLLRRRKVVDRLKDNVATRQAPLTDLEIESSIDIKRALSTLTEQERAAILLCDAHGFTHQEAAHMISTPLGSLKTYIKRARRKMRAALETEK